MRQKIEFSLYSETLEINMYADYLEKNFDNLVTKQFSKWDSTNQITLNQYSHEITVNKSNFNLNDIFLDYWQFIPNIFIVKHFFNQYGYFIKSIFDKFVVNGIMGLSITTIPYIVFLPAKLMYFALQMKLYSIFVTK